MPASWIVVLLVTLVVVGASIAAMAIGVILRRPCLRGSCGGRELRDADGQRLSCATCPRRRKSSAEVKP
jgi:hypothetical protein